MTPEMLVFLHYFFLIFHTVFTLFNMTGWIWKKTRRIHMITMGLTALSWFVLGIWYGWGYCVCTDWHWQVLEKLGTDSATNSYINYLIRELTGFKLSDSTVDTGTAFVFSAIVVLTFLFNGRDYLRKRKTV
jgi:hypothetical protein